MEIEILDGAKETIESNNPNLFIEINESKYLKKGLSIVPYLLEFKKMNKSFYIENKKKEHSLEITLNELLIKIKNSKENFNLFVG